ncbi:MAG: hypothetical protein AB7O67_19900 [Vicinamibacterales bacterium]
MNRAAAALIAAVSLALPTAVLTGVLSPVSLAARAQAQEQVLYVSAWDTGSHAPVSDLAADQFVVREDGVRREILRVAPATDPMAIAVVVDNSAEASDTIANLRRALQAFLPEAAKLGPTALVSVADRPTILQDYTTSADALVQASQRIFAPPGSGATLLDAIREVSQGLRRRPESRAAIVLVATERTEFTQLHHTQVLAALEDGGASLHALVLQSPGAGLGDTAARERASVLDRGPKETGGVRIDVLSSMAYDDRLMDIAGILGHQYKVTYARPGSLIPPETTEVSVTRAGVEARGTPAREGARP